MSAFEALVDVAKRANPGFKPLAADESDSDYFTRLAFAVSATTKDSFDAMPIEAQNWFDHMADAMSAGTPLPPPGGYDRAALLDQKPRGLTRPSTPAAQEPPPQPPQPTPPSETPPQLHVAGEPQPGFIESVEQPPPTQRHEASPETLPTRSTRRGRNGRQPPADDGKPPVPNENSVAGISRLVTQWLIADRNLKVNDIVQRLETEHKHEVKNRSTLQSTRYNVLKTMEIAEEMGWRPPT